MTYTPQPDGVREYRKKPVATKAVRLCWKTWGDVCDFLGAALLAVNPNGARTITADEASDTCGEPGPKYIALDVRTVHGEIATVRHGDWIIPDAKPDTFYPCKPDVFAATYEPVGDEPSAQPDAPFMPPAARDLPAAALESAVSGASALDAWATTGYGRNVIAHALAGLAQDGWLRAVPDAGQGQAGKDDMDLAGLQRELKELERTDPDVAAAAASFERMKQNILSRAAGEEERQPSEDRMNFSQAQLRLVYTSDPDEPVNPRGLQRVATWGYRQAEARYRAELGEAHAETSTVEGALAAERAKHLDDCAVSDDEVTNLRRELDRVRDAEHKANRERDASRQRFSDLQTEHVKTAESWERTQARLEREKAARRAAHRDTQGALDRLRADHDAYRATAAEIETAYLRSHSDLAAEKDAHQATRDQRDQALTLARRAHNELHLLLDADWQPQPAGRRTCQVPDSELAEGRRVADEIQARLAELRTTTGEADR